MAARSQIHFFCGRKNFKNSTAEIIQILQTAFPTKWRCACDFLKVLLKFKMAAMHELHNFLWAQKLKN